MKTLCQISKDIFEYDIQHTIYASEPWKIDSAAIVLFEPGGGRLPSEAASKNLKYFLEISISQQLIEEWTSSNSKMLEQKDICERLIRYAINDA